MVRRVTESTKITPYYITTQTYLRFYKVKHISINVCHLSCNGSHLR
jgi:hypothetical protein